MYGLEIAQPLRYSYSADLLDLQSAIDLTFLDGRSVLEKHFFQNVQRGLYNIYNKLELVTYPLKHSRRIYSPIKTFRFIWPSR